VAQIESSGVLMDQETFTRLELVLLGLSMIVVFIGWHGRLHMEITNGNHSTTVAGLVMSTDRMSIKKDIMNANNSSLV